MKRSVQFDTTNKSANKYEKTRNLNSFADSEMFNSSTKGRRNVQTQQSFYQTQKTDSAQKVDSKFKKHFRPSSTLSAGNPPNFNFRPSSTLSAGNPPNFIKLYNPSNNSKVQITNDSKLILSYEKSKKILANDSKLILSHDQSRPFSPPQKQFIPTAQFHTKSAQRLIESKKNASSIKVKDLNIMIKSTVQDIQSRLSSPRVISPQAQKTHSKKASPRQIPPLAK